MIAWTTELFLRVAFELGHKPGLVLPGGNASTRVIRPDSPEGLLLEQLKKARSRVTDDDLVSRLEQLEQISANLQFAIVISDFMSPGWEQKLINIGRRLELVVFQIIDPWDLQLPANQGRLSVVQNGTCVKINTKRRSVRRAYQKKASQHQVKVAATMKQARASHYKLKTNEPILEQLMEIFRPLQFAFGAL